MELGPERFLELLQLADSAFPVGGFAFSGGLECAVQSGFVRNGEELRDYLENLSDQFRSFELVFVRSIFREDDPWASIRRFDTMLLLPASRRASITQGRSWMRSIGAVFPGLDGRHLEARRRQEGIPPHFLPLFTLSLKEAGFALEEVCILYFFVQMRDQLNAAIRLGVVGPGAAQSLQAGLWRQSARAVLEPGGAGEEPFRFTPLVELFQAGHDDLYSKIFQS